MTFHLPRALGVLREVSYEYPWLLSPAAALTGCP